VLQDDRNPKLLNTTSASLHIFQNMQLIFLLSLSFSLVHSADANTTVHFAGMFPSWPNKARVPGFVLEAGTRLALDHINSDSKILPDYTLDMVTGDSKVRYILKYNHV
jgi:enamine deaminase RidA (YjgF/YER057c/UK114 family)